MRKRDELICGCMAKARPDEMTFVLLARDAAAPVAIRAWIAERVRLGKNRPHDEQIVDLYFCPSSGPGATVIARYGDDGDYTSGLPLAHLDERLAEAKRRAEARGLLKP